MISGRKAAFAGLMSVGLASVFAMLLAMGACSSDDDAHYVGISGEDGAAPTGNDAASSTDAGTDTSTVGPSGPCVGACKTTALVGDFGGKTRTLQRSQFGTQTGDGGVAQLHTESHLGGEAACPTMSSPSPDYTLILSSIPRGAVGRKLTERDGLTSAFFDFKGDLGLPPLTKSVSINATVTAEDTATPPAWAAIDVYIGFTEGNVKGHLYAEYCASLSE